MWRFFSSGGLLTALAVVALVAITPPSVAADVVEINAQQLKEMMDTSDVLVIFPLSRIEFNHLHIKGSINIPLEEIQTKLPADKNRRLVFYCLGRT